MLEDGGTEQRGSRLVTNWVIMEFSSVMFHPRAEHDHNHPVGEWVNVGEFRHFHSKNTEIRSNFSELAIML